MTADHLYAFSYRMAYQFQTRREELFENMSLEELSGWIAFERANGIFGPQRDNYYNAATSTLLVNANSTKKVELEDMLVFPSPHRGNRRKEMKPEEAMIFFEAMARASAKAEKESRG